LEDKPNAVKLLSVQVKEALRDSVSQKKIFGFLDEKDLTYLKSLISPFYKRIALITSLNVIQAFLSGIQALLVVVFIKSLFDKNYYQSQVDIFGFNLNIPDWLIIGNESQVLLSIFIMLALVSILSLVFLVIMNHLNLVLQNNILFVMKKDLVGKIYSLSSSFFNDTKIGEIEHLQSNTIRRFGFLITATQVFINATLNTIVVLVILLSAAPLLSSAFIVIGFIFFLIVHIFTSKITKLSFDLDVKSLNLSEHFFDILTGIRLIKQADKENDVLNKYMHLVNNQQYSSRKLSEYQTLLKGITEAGAIFIVILVGLVFSFILENELLKDFGYTTGLVFLFYSLFSHIRKLLNARMQQANTLPQVSFFRRFLDFTEDNQVEFSNNDNLGQVRKLQIKNLSFSYSSENILQDINLNFVKGKVYALVGLSGSGKTTLLEIISGFLKSDSGNLKLNDVNLYSFSKNLIRKKIGYVNQDPIIFHDTIHNNLIFLNQEASIKQINSVLNEVGLSDFLKKKKYGVDTFVGERGSKLSGGQKQRLSIARTILQEPEILIMDEATSSLDLLSESKIYDYLIKTKDSKITILTAHRLSAIKNVDEIIVINKGKISEIGTHEELMKNDGLYKKTFDIQGYEN